MRSLLDARTPADAAVVRRLAGGRCFAAMRPGELDALSWPQIDFDAGSSRSTSSGTSGRASFPEPKSGPYTIALVDHAKRQLAQDPARREPTSSRRCEARTTRRRLATPLEPRARRGGLGDMTLYLATRHYFGYYALDVLELEPSVIAVQLGHRDGGRLVEEPTATETSASRWRKIRRHVRERRPGAAGACARRTNRVNAAARADGGRATTTWAPLGRCGRSRTSPCRVDPTLNTEVRRRGCRRGHPDSISWRAQQVHTVPATRSSRLGGEAAETDGDVDESADP